MHYLQVFLILVSTLSLGQTDEFYFKHYNEPRVMFGHIETNGNGLLDLVELTASFNGFKEKPTDNSVTKARFVDILVKYGAFTNVANILFHGIDTDHSGALTKADYDALYENLNTDGKVGVCSDEFVSGFDNLLSAAVF